MDIGGTGLEASAREDGSGYDVGEGMSLDADGMGEVTEGGGTFRVLRDDDGMLMATRFDMDIVGDPMVLVSKGTHTNPPKLSTDNKDMPGNQKNTMVNIVGADFSIGDLLGGGSATATGPNIVAKARADIVKIRDRVVQLVALAADDSGFNLREQLETQWINAEEIVQRIYGSSEEVEETYNASRVVDAFDSIVEALSSADALAAATLKDGPDRLQGLADRSAANAAKDFAAVQWTAEARLGSLGSTRFGAATRKHTTKAQTATAADRSQAFAWSTMQDTRRATDVQVSGFASYEGQTRAADQAGNLYSGSIDIQVRFTRMAVDGLVTGLARADTDAPFSHGLGGEVTSIVLPTARLNTRGDWDVTTQDDTVTGTGRFSFETRAGGSPDEDLEAGSTFTGRLLGRGDEAGDEAIGTWTAKKGSTTLVGGFGATRGADRAPPGTGVIDDLAKIGKTAGQRALMERGPTVALGAIAVGDTLEGGGTAAAADVRAAVPAFVSAVHPNDTNTKFKYDPPEQDELGAPEYVRGAYEPQRAEVLEDGEFELERQNWVVDARAEIVKKLAQLRRSIALDNADASAGDTKFANDQRQRLFNEIQEQIRNVFGPDKPAGSDPMTDPAIDTGVLTTSDPLGATAAWDEHEDYPVNSSGVAQDAGVLNEIEDVLAALADADAFAAALDDGGVFAGMDLAKLFPNMPNDPTPTAAAIFNRPRGKLSFVAEATDYTRLGVWRHQVSAYAADNPETQTYRRQNRGPETGSFAYSPLDPTAAYSGPSSRLYPASGASGRVTATYAGQTAAVQGNTFYRGDVETKVYWNNTTIINSEVKVTVTNLRDTDSGDRLQFGFAREGYEELVEDKVGTVDVESLTWTAKVTNSGTVGFGGADTEVTVEVAVDSVSGTPNWRPNLPAGHGGVLQNGVRHPTHYNVGNNDQLWYIRADQSSGNDYAYAVVQGGGDFGRLIFGGVDDAPRSGTNTAHETSVSDPDVVAEKAVFEAGQMADSLAFPTYIVEGPNVKQNTQAAGGATAFRPTSILLFADGSTRMLDRWSAIPAPNNGEDRGLIGAPYPDGTIASPQNLYNLGDDSGPLTDALLFNDLGMPWSKDFSDPLVPGTGAGDVTPGSLATAYLRDGGYVNVLESDTAARASTIEGMFVGQDQDGPLGLIGTWTLTGGAFGTGTERGVIRGAFGADIQP